jgi:hypothetical protein
MRLRSIALAAVLLVAPAAQAFEGVLHVKTNVQPMGALTSTIYVRENGDMRMDNEMPAMGMAMSVLRRHDKKAVVQLMHAQKQYMEMPDAPPAKGGSGHTLDDFDVKRLGKEKLIGLEAEHVKLIPKKGGPDMELWITKDLALGDTMKLMAQDPSFDASLFASMKKAGLDGYPIKIMMKQDGHTMTVETTKIEKKKLAADLFDVPKGYAKTTMPAMPQMGPEQMEMIRKMAEQQGGEQ